MTELLDWTAIDDRAVDTARVLAMDAVQQAGNGHPGTAMSLAPIATLLFQRYLRHDPHDPAWLGRDRFVLSCGHSSLTLYTQLYLCGYGLELDDLRAYRSSGSLTPGHPEFGHTAGVETTTGPLGQGIANGVGMAMAARRERGLLDPDAPVGSSPFDHTIWVIASDGDLQEGVSAEASAIAGHQRLSNLVVIWDDNRISIEGDTGVAFTEDVRARYVAYGWHVINVEDGEDVLNVSYAFDMAIAEPDRPTLIAVRTVIAHPSPNKAGTAGSHGSALGAAEVAATKKVLGFDPTESFAVSDVVLERTRSVVERAQEQRSEWDRAFGIWRATHPEASSLLQRMTHRTLPDGWQSLLPFRAADGASISTRAASGEVINALAPAIPELWGGSADLAESNNTTIAAEPSFLPLDRQTEQWEASPYGRVLHFGIREHAMGAILNGIALHGGTRPFGGTFLVFSDYMRPAVRMAALMQLPVTYVWTHDSIGLGEDGPTHQPIEHLWALRLIPGLSVVRPADANETTAAWMATLAQHRPVALALTRQGVPTLIEGRAARAGVPRGGYIVADVRQPEVILIGTGSELQIALEAQRVLDGEGVATRVVSMPCVEWFEEQDAAYRGSVLPGDVQARVSIEAGATAPWWKYVGTHGRVIGLDHFGASAPAEVLYEQFGLTVDAVVAAAKESLASARTATAPPA